MSKFGKGYNVKIVLLIMAVGFFMSNAAYPAAYSLRVEVGRAVANGKLKDAMELQLSREERVVQAFELLQTLANEMKIVIENSKFLDIKKSLKEWAESKDKNKDPAKARTLAQDMFDEYRKMRKIYLERFQSILKDEYDSVKYFVDLDGNGYFKFTVDYDLDDRLGKPLMHFGNLIENETVGNLEQKIRRVVEKNDVYLQLLEDIKSPTEKVLTAAETMLEANIEPEKTYKFLAYYYRMKMQGQTVKVKPALYDAIIENIALISDKVFIKEKEADNIDMQVARVYKAVFGDILQSLLNLNKKDIFNKAEQTQSVIRKLEDNIEDRFKKDNVEQITKDILGLTEEDNSFNFVVSVIHTDRDRFLENLRIIKTLLTEIKPASIKSYIVEDIKQAYRRKLIEVATLYPSEQECRTTLWGYAIEAPDYSGIDIECFTAYVAGVAKFPNLVFFEKGKFLICDIAPGKFVINKDVKENDVMGSGIALGGCGVAIVKGESEDKIVMSFTHLSMGGFHLKHFLDEVDNLKLKNPQVIFLIYENNRSGITRNELKELIYNCSEDNHPTLFRAQEDKRVKIIERKSKARVFSTPEGIIIAKESNVYPFLWSDIDSVPAGHFKSIDDLLKAILISTNL
ncbi:MAG: hypothetical protein P9L93_04545 [Candidatus Gorgyraea atricola]|nr:hypothetical protein [Candidatus Gorgyraea atricola]